MKKICKQCGAEFELSASEIEFYKSKNLSLPKRCKKCRKQNKQQTPTYKGNNTNYNNNLYNSRNTVNNNFNSNDFLNYNNNNYYNKKSPKKKLIVATILICVLILAVFGISQVILNNYEKILDEYVSDVLPTAVSENIATATEPATEIVTEQITEQQTEAENPPAESQTVNSYGFRNNDLLQEHYQKHGIEMGFASAGDYLTAANAVINNPNALHKLEKEDGDDVYYLQASNEFVVVSTDGCIRTYFYPNDGIEYYNRQ